MSSEVSAANPRGTERNRLSDPYRGARGAAHGVGDSLAIVLALFDRDPKSFSRNAARWGSRLTLERKLDLADSQLVLASLATPPGLAPQAGAEALIELTDRHDLRRVDELVALWMRARGLGD